MDVSITVVLPKENSSVGSVRRLCRATLREVGVDTATADEVELAVAEACNNAIKHTGAFGYEAHVTANDEGCIIRVIDAGPGFNGEHARGPSPFEERGRGIAVMRALADQVRFEVRQEGGTVVTLERRFCLS